MNTWIAGLPADKVKQWIAKNGERAMDIHRTDDPHFALWLHYVDRAVRRRIHLSYMDLEDWDYWSAYDGGMSPAEAALEALSYNEIEEWF